MKVTVQATGPKQYTTG